MNEFCRQNRKLGGAMLFQNECAMQKWLESELAKHCGLLSIIDNEYEIKNYEEKNDTERKIKDSFTICLDSLEHLHLISSDQNISVDKKDKMRPDIVAYSIERNSLVLMELKNIKGPTRQAGTELSAYAAELKGYLSHLSDGDIINVIISCEWPSLLNHYIFNTIVWQNKNLICLEPFKNESGDIKLRCKKIESIIQADIYEKFAHQHLEGFHVSLYDYALGSKKLSESLLHEKIDVIKVSMAMMAAESEKDHSHGFAILCQRNDNTNVPYVITIVNASGFASIERHFHNESFETIDDLPIIGKCIHDINETYCNTGLSASTLKAYNRSRITLDKICSPRIEGPNSWLTLQELTNSPYLEKVHIELWGVFKEKYFEMISELIEDGDTDYEFSDDLISMQCIIDDMIYENYEHIRIGNYS
ncbi:hypothetical protein [Serratia marcescens]|uniref:hypothetical protein n=1 Tax=Serratia marcescens TaxID=615 RepID=UPI0027E4EBF6|nr:hypothetical protein [Serratia marcescens]